MEKATEEKKEKRISKKVILSGSNPKERFTAVIDVANDVFRSLIIKYIAESKLISISVIAEHVSVQYSAGDLFISCEFSLPYTPDWEIKYIVSNKEKWQKKAISIRDAKEMLSSLIDYYFDAGVRESPLTAEIKTAVKAEIKQALLNKKLVFKVALEDVKPIL